MQAESAPSPDHQWEAVGTLSARRRRGGTGRLWQSHWAGVTAGRLVAASRGQCRTLLLSPVENESDGRSEKTALRSHRTLVGRDWLRQGKPVAPSGATSKIVDTE